MCTTHHYSLAVLADHCMMQTIWYILNIPGVIHLKFQFTPTKFIYICPKLFVA